MEGTGERGGSRVQSTSASYWLLRCLVKEISVSQPKAPKKIMPQSAFLCGHAPSPRSHLVPATPACFNALVEPTSPSTCFADLSFWEKPNPLLLLLADDEAAAALYV
uniref:Uncharacterized protein n=1 Tax=Chrysotila carterae TaxID=13221 RepID=A0A7S4F702_CHRCT|mmetsp:Transcript_1644/g.3300  ORF Transcript_1644/g.3300 Transcript_1644/m.3300 type:complete len:107 (-) Transcript_1644:1197-1517(-)